jgi:hypothetical protein
MAHRVKPRRNGTCPKNSKHRKGRKGCYSVKRK